MVSGCVCVVCRGGKFADGGRESGDLRLVSSLREDGGRRIKVKREEATVTGCDRSAATRVEGEGGERRRLYKQDSQVKDGDSKDVAWVPVDGGRRWRSGMEVVSCRGVGLGCKREGGEVRWAQSALVPSQKPEEATNQQDFSDGFSAHCPAGTPQAGVSLLGFQTRHDLAKRVPNIFAPPSGGVMVMSHDKSVRAEVRGRSHLSATGQPREHAYPATSLSPVCDDGRITNEGGLIVISK